MSQSLKKKNIKFNGLFSCDPLYPNNKICHMVSTNIDLLNQQYKKQEKRFSNVNFIINELQLWQCSKIIESSSIFNLNGKNKDLLFVKIDYCGSDTKKMKGKIFAWNKNNNTINTDTLILLCNDHSYDSLEYKQHLDKLRTEKYFLDHMLSTNPLEFNVFYEEGIMNA